MHNYLKTPWLIKIHFTNYLEISKRKIQISTSLHSDFEWKHSNLRLRLYLSSKIIGKYKTIAKMLWPMIQVNVPLMFYINEITVSLEWHKTGFMIFFLLWHFGLSWSTIHVPPSLLPITQHHEKRCDHPTPMRDIIFEQTLNVHQ